MKTNERWKESLLDELLDFMINLFDVTWAIEWLIDSGYSKNQIIELGFADVDIDEIIKEKNNREEE